MYIEYFFIALTCLYLLTHLFLYKGLRVSLKLPKNTEVDLPKVSVIVAGRNEEANIAACINSLSKINYPSDLLEIIIVNDNSTDKTYDIMIESAKEFSFMKVINSRKSTSKNLKGKANAIDTAIDICSGDIIVSTDADCAVDPDWVSSTVRYFKADAGMVCGFTMITGDSIFAKVQCIDWLYLLSLASSSAGLNLILSCVGNNLSFKKKVYSDVGGYESIGFSVTEDLALMRKVDSNENYRILFPVDKSCLVRSLPCTSINELFSQKRRWFRGGIGINFLGYIVGVELYLMNVLLIFGLFFVSPKIFLILAVIKILSELILVENIFKRLSLQSLYVFYPLFSIYFAIYGLILPLSFLFKIKIKWKGQKF